MTKYELRKRLSAHGLRLTRQRAAVLETLQHTTSHPDAYTVHRQVQVILPDISLGTVYRALKVLTEAGMLHEMTCGQFSRYDGNVIPHGHATCRQCGRIVDVDVPIDDRLNDLAGNATGFTILSRRVEFEGICPDCAMASRL
jgi:Fur family transcriptional regulator, peroxide stress response regulator